MDTQVIILLSFIALIVFFTAYELRFKVDEISFKPKDGEWYGTRVNGRDIPDDYLSDLLEEVDKKK